MQVICTNALIKQKYWNRNIAMKNFKNIERKILLIMLKSGNQSDTERGPNAMSWLLLEISYCCIYRRPY